MAQNLASKYRPKTLDEMTEQSIVVDIVRNLCNSENISNRNFLFTGPAGCGKTTISRCIAGMLNNGLGEPIEIDAASHSGADAMRDIVNQARSYPVGTPYKIFIIDEVHSISQQGWQVLLKTLEEQPAKSIFLLCTTNPEKIPATILSRVQTFQLSKISLTGIVNRLKYIVEKENEDEAGITYTEDALTFIAKLAQGGMRDAITNLDKALSFSKDLTISNLSQSLNLPDYEDYFTMLRAIVKKDNDAIVRMINDVYNSGSNFVRWFERFFAFVTNIVKYIYLQDINQTMIPSSYESSLANYGIKHSVKCLALSKSLSLLINELKTTQYLQETAISHLCFADSSQLKEATKNAQHT